MVRFWSERLIGLAVILLLLSGGQAEAAATRHASEGASYTFQSGDKLSWTGPAADMMLVIQTGSDGAEIDVTGLQLDYDPERIKDPGPNASLAMSVSLDGRTERSVFIRRGTGVLILARNDLGTIPYGRPIDRLDADGSVQPGECHAYMYSTLSLTENYRVNARGSNVRFTFYDRHLAVLAEGVGEASASLDPQGPANQVVIQACRGAPLGTGSYSVEVLYPDPGNPPIRTVGQGWSWLGAAGLGAIIAGLFIWRRLRGRAMD